MLHVSVFLLLGSSVREREYVGSRLSHLHRHLSVIDEDLPRKEIGTNRCLVARTELLVDLFGFEDHVRNTADAHDATG